jgi:hypothetical protein
LIKIYDRAEAFARQHTDDWAASGLVVNPPGTVVPEHRHFDVSKMTLTYVISNLVSENNSTLYIGDQAIEFPKNQREFFFCLDSNMNHYTTRQESDLNCYLFFTFDDVVTTLEPNKFYVQPNT